MNGKIYLVTNLKNKLQYVGQTTKTVKKRWKQHINSSKCSTSTKKKRQSYLHRAINKHGPDNFEILVLEENINNYSLLNSLETKYIKKYKTVSPKGYNINPTGEGFPRHPETLEKMSKGRKDNNLCVPVKCYNPKTKAVKIFDATADAAKSLNLQGSEVTNRLKGKRKGLHKGWLILNPSDVIPSKEEIVNIQRNNKKNENKKVYAKCLLTGKVSCFNSLVECASYLGNSQLRFNISSCLKGGKRKECNNHAFSLDGNVWSTEPLPFYTEVSAPGEESVYKVTCTITNKSRFFSSKTKISKALKCTYTSIAKDTYKHFTIKKEGR